MADSSLVMRSSKIHFQINYTEWLATVIMCHIIASGLLYLIESLYILFSSYTSPPPSLSLTENNLVYDIGALFIYSLSFYM